MCNDNDNNDDVNDDDASYFIYYRFDAQNRYKFTLLHLYITIFFSAIFSLSTKTFIAQLLVRSRRIHSMFMVRWWMDWEKQKKKLECTENIDI